MEDRLYRAIRAVGAGIFTVWRIVVFLVYLVCLDKFGQVSRVVLSFVLAVLLLYCLGDLASLLPPAVEGGLFGIFGAVAVIVVVVLARGSGFFDQWRVDQRRASRRLESLVRLNRRPSELLSRDDA